MPGLFAAILISGATGFFLTAALFLLVEKMPRTETGAGWWAASSMAAGAGYVALLVLANQGRPIEGEAVYNILFVVWITALVFGAHNFLHQRGFEKWLLVISGILCLWLIVFSFVYPVFLPAAIPVALYCGGLNIYMGFLWMQKIEKRSVLHNALIAAFLISGLHWLDYPVLRHVEWFAPIGFTLCAVVSVVINGILAVLVIEQFRRRTENAERAAVMAARSDALTGLNNRIALDLLFEQAAANATRHEKGLALLFVDLDGFKEINDTHGHETGDLVLVEIAERLKTAFRDSDIVARIGGDEFVTILGDMDMNDETSAEHAAIVMLDMIDENIKFEDFNCRVTASIGISYYPRHGKTLNHLMLAADKAMYASKSNGKGKFLVAT
ncbi:MAG: diguanylate cyclase [Alphaproteobacteria bacterium]|nr:diguanylate cyclase [Alphaproteobacteria bacterium]